MPLVLLHPRKTIVNTSQQQMVDRKLEPVIKHKMTEYLGELEDDDLVMFIVEHLKDKKRTSETC